MSPEIRTTYIDFDLRVFKAGPESYIVTAQTAGSGLAQSTLDWDALNSDDVVSLLERIREEPFTTDESLLKEVGRTLFAALLDGQVRDHFFSVYSQRVQSSEGVYLRLRMDIDESAPEVATLPWELMARDDMYLATQTKTMVTRQLLNLDYGNIQSLNVKGKPSVLIVIPRGSGLETDVEERTITTALDNVGIPYELLKGKVTIQMVDDALASSACNVLHFVGHGDFEQGEDSMLHGSLRFNSGYENIDEQDDEEWIKDTQLQSLLGNHDTLKLVVLNACLGAEVALRRSGRGFIGTAPALLRARIPAVIAMQYAIRDDVALQFAETFYKRLTSGRWAGHVDMAMTLARNACYLNYPNDRGFATPILYLRSKDGVIIDLYDETDEAHPIPPPGELAITDSSGCVESEQPSAIILFENRNSTVEMVADDLTAVREQLALAQQNLHAYERAMFTDPMIGQGGTLDIRINRARKQVEDLRTRVDDMRIMLRWKLYEMCRTREKTAQELEDLLSQRDRLVSRHRQIPPSLSNDITTNRRKLASIEQRMQRAQATVDSHA